MYAYYKPGKVDLTADDVAGFCAIYPQPAKSSGGCVTAPRATGAAGGSSGEGGGLMLAGMVLLTIVRRKATRQAPSRRRCSRKNMSTESVSRV